MGMPEIPVRTSQDVADLIRRYQRGQSGLGLLRLKEEVERSELPEDLKRKFLLQYATGMLYPEEFDQ
jgi:hypothetical protein